jgi:flagellar biosynthesis/type III secretory pathway protein FliH
MARVIKAGAGQAGARPARPATRVLAQADVKKVIEKELYLAKQEAEELLKRAEDERRQILAEGKHLAARAREEAMSRGASQAFATAAEEALSAFRARADRYDEAADDIRILALEIAAKVLGAPPDLARPEIERILTKGLEQLRARRKVRVLVSPGRRAELAFERPNLMKAVDAQPDVLIEEAGDVGPGFARVVTEVGGALCAEDSAMEALAQTVNVKEAPRLRGTGPSSGATQVGVAPVRPGSAHTAELGGDDDDDDRVDDIDRDDAGDETDDFRRSLHDADPDQSERLVRPDLDDLSSIADAAIADEALPSVPDLDDLPDAIIEDVDEDEDATRALPAPLPRPVRPTATTAPHRVQATPPPPSSLAGATTKRPAIIKAGGTPIAAGGRRPVAATRVLALDAQEQLRDQTRRAHDAGDDDDLELFTDRRPGRR